MGVTFNAEEVFRMAIRIEQNGAAFYRKAASLQSEKENKDLLQNLAGMEEDHEKTFESMRDRLGGDDKKEQTYDPEGETGLYLSAMSDAHGGEGSPKAADKLTGGESMEQIVNMALDLERKSILYYVGLKDMTPARLGQDKVDSIIAEERSHVAQLAGVLEKTRG